MQSCSLAWTTRNGCKGTSNVCNLYKTPISFLDLLAPKLQNIIMWMHDKQSTSEKVGHMIAKNPHCLLFLLAVSVVWQYCWGNEGFSVVLCYGRGNVIRLLWAVCVGLCGLVWTCVDLCVGSYWSRSNLLWLGVICLFNLRLTLCSGHLLLGNTGHLTHLAKVWHPFCVQSWANTF